MNLFTTTEIINSLKKYLKDEGEVKQKDISSFIALLAKQSKNGLSAREVAKNIIIRQKEAGAPIGALADGSNSIVEKMEYIRVEEILKHIITNSKIQVVIPSGTKIVGQGISPSGTVAVTGIVSGIATGVGIIT